jgi:hypothetical protein
MQVRELPRHSSQVFEARPLLPHRQPFDDGRDAKDDASFPKSSTDARPSVSNPSEALRDGPIVLFRPWTGRARLDLGRHRGRFRFAQNFRVAVIAGSKAILFKPSDSPSGVRGHLFASLPGST